MRPGRGRQRRGGKGRDEGVCADRFSMTRAIQEGVMGTVAGRRSDELLSPDIARLNEMLRAGLSFELVGLESLPTSAGARGARDEAVVRASGVLAQAVRGAARRVASHPVALAARRRDRLLALSSCLAECAMDLGLGVGVCRGRSGGE